MKINSNSKNSTRQVFKNEFTVLEKSKNILKNNNIIKEDLLEDYKILSQEYEKLLNIGIKLTTISDKYYGILLQANETINEQKEELENINAKQKQLLKTLRELNATKDKFFSIIAHDLRGSFSVLIEGTDVLLANINTLDKEEIKWLAERVNANTKNLFNLLENLLQWSRIQMGVIQHQPTKFSLNEAVKKCVDLLMDHALKKNIHLINEIDKPIFVYADNNMVNSIIRNLVHNSIKFTNSEGKIRIIAKVQDSFVELSVSDTGVGMDQKMIKKLFRVDEHQTTLGTADEKGTGLGLILCKEFIEKWGGKIWIESQPGEGTSVKLTLPLFS